MPYAGRMIEPVYVTLGDNIAHARQRRKLTQDQLAKALGVARPYITMVESGQRRIMLHDIEKIAHILRIKPQTLLKNVWGMAHT